MVSKGIHVEIAEAMRSIGPEITNSITVRVHLHPADLETLKRLVSRIDHGAVEDLIPLTWQAGTVEVGVGHPVRRGMARAERADGSYEWIELRERNERWIPGWYE